MKTTGYIVLVYGILVIIGGLIGFAKANSVPSLVMGTSFGIVLAICGWAITKDSTVSIYVAGLFALLLTCFFAYRFLNSYIFMPAGLMTLLSIAALITLFLEGMKKQ